VEEIVDTSGREKASHSAARMRGEKSRRCGSAPLRGIHGRRSGEERRRHQLPFVESTEEERLGKERGGMGPTWKWDVREESKRHHVGIGMAGLGHGHEWAVFLVFFLLLFLHNVYINIFQNFKIYNKSKNNINTNKIHIWKLIYFGQNSNN
jgi:hypothetical protein